MANIHLLVLIHGMWGNPTHLAYVDKVIRQVKGNAGPDEPELAVLVAQTNRDDSTYDGIDWGGERVAQEVCLSYLPKLELRFCSLRHINIRSWKKSRSTRKWGITSLASPCSAIV
jgi:hypothetical protein